MPLVLIVEPTALQLELQFVPVEGLEYYLYSIKNQMKLFELIY